MFKFFKDKLKGAISKFGKKVDEEGVEEQVDSGVEQPAQAPADAPSEVAKPNDLKKPKSEKKPKATLKETKAKVQDRVKDEVRPKEPASKKSKSVEKNDVVSAVSDAQELGVIKPIHKQEESKGAESEGSQPAAKKGFFSRITEKITTKKITSEQFEEMFWDLELALLENNVAVQVIEKIKEDLKRELVDTPIARSGIEARIMASLRRSVGELFVVPDIDVLALSETKKPLVICFIGINGSGKTTTIAKMAHLFQEHGKSVVLAAADTFRAAAIDQLQFHADKLGVKLIRHDYGADAAAVAFDAISHAKAKGRDVVLIDTAGRLHSNHNLVDEMKKIVRVANPDLKIFVGESITGNDCIEQAVKFDEAVGLDGIVLSKADIDEKGGAAVSVSFVTRKPILYMGTGQEYGDLELFSAESILSQLFA